MIRRQIGRGRVASRIHMARTPSPDRKPEQVTVNP